MKLRLVPARTGWTWVKLGMRTFARQPLALAGLFFMFMAAVSVLSLVPVLGTVLSLALLPAATLGLMVAAREAASGQFPMPGVLVSAFRAGRERVRHMAVLGAIYAAGFVAVIGVSALFDGGDFARLYLVGGGIGTETLQEADFQRALWVAMLLYLPLALLFWHAPALVHWHGIEPVKSLFFSLMACWRNRGAMLVFMLGWTGVFLAAGLVLSVLGGMLGSPAVLAALMFPVAMVMAAMFFSSLYFTFRDSFEADDAA